MFDDTKWKAMKMIKTVRNSYKEELVFYKAYHRNKSNWLIHAVTIPFEWASWLLLLACINMHWYVALSCAVYYTCIGSKISILASVAQIIYCWGAHETCRHFGLYTSVAIVVAVQLSSWFAQVCIGHYLIEKNQPAMATKLTLNSIFLSPMIAWDY